MKRRPIRHPSSAASPQGWLPLARVLGETGIDERTLNKWRARFLIPRPFTAAIQRGAVSFYRPETVAIIRRLQAIRRETHSADDWLWRLWLEGYPVEMREWAAARLDKFMNWMTEHAGVVQSRDVIEAVAAKIATMSGGRIRSAERAGDLVDWALVDAATGDPDAAPVLTDPEGPPIYDTLRKVGGLPASGFPPPETELLGLLKLGRLAEVVSEARDDEMEQARRDWQTIGRLVAAVERVDWGVVVPIISPAVAEVIGARPEPPSWQARKARRVRPPSRPAIVGFLVGRWKSFDDRAAVLAFLIGARRPSNSDPDRSKRITEILALADWAVTLFQKAAQSS